MPQCSICKLTWLAKQIFIATNDSFGTKLDMEVLGFFIEGKSNTVLPSGVDRLSDVSIDDVKVLINIIILLIDVLTRGKEAWLEGG